MKAEDFGADPVAGRIIRCVEHAVKADNADHIATATGQVEDTQTAEAVAHGRDPGTIHLSLLTQGCYTSRDSRLQQRTILHKGSHQCAVFLKAGTEHTLPVQYADTHNGFVVAVGKPDTKNWWRNFTTMGQVQVLVAGTWTPMTAHALIGSEDPDAVTPLLRSYATRFPKVVNTLDGDTLDERVEQAVVVWLRPAA